MKRLHPPKLVPGETVIWLCGFKIYLKQLTNLESVLCVDEQLYSPCLRQHNNRVGCIVICPALFHFLAECISSPFCQFARSGFVKPRLPASDSTTVNFLIQVALHCLLYLQRVRVAKRSIIVMAIGGRKSKPGTLSRPPTEAALTLTNRRKYREIEYLYCFVFSNLERFQRRLDRRKLSTVEIRA